jgi:hypothetical protein
MRVHISTGYEPACWKKLFAIKGFIMRAYFIWILICLVLAGCATLPNPELERSLPVDRYNIREEGTFTYRADTKMIPLPSWPYYEGGIAIEANIFREVGGPLGSFPMFWDDNRAIVSEASFTYRGKETSTTLEMRYVIGLPDQKLSFRKLPPGIEFQSLDYGDIQGKELALPFVVLKGTWKGLPIKILCTRDYKYSEEDGIGWLYDLFPWPKHKPGFTPLGDVAFSSVVQKYQVVDSQEQVLAELQRGRFRVFDTVAEEDQSSIIAVLGVIVDIYWFTRFVSIYRQPTAKEENAQDIRLQG